MGDICWFIISAGEKVYNRYMTKAWLKRIGLLLLVFPLVVLFLFLFGEVFSGDISGLGHLVQLIPVILIAFLAWKKPFIGGAILVAAGAILGILYFANVDFPWQTILIAEVLLFLPPIISGILLICSSFVSKKEK